MPATRIRAACRLLAVWCGDLEDLFTPYGEVTSARISRAYHGGYPRGFGYVEMLTQNAEIAISELQWRRIDFMVLRVGEAKP